MNRKGFTLVELVVVIAIIGVLAAILIPTMMSYIKKAKLKSANSNAKIVFNTVNSVVTDMQCEGKDVDVRSCTAVVDCTAEPDSSKKLEKAVHDALNVNGDNAGYAFWIAGEDGRYKLAQWCDTQTPVSNGIVGQYPDPAKNVDELPENFSWGVKF